MTTPRSRSPALLISSAVLALACGDRSSLIDVPTPATTEVPHLAAGATTCLTIHQAHPEDASGEYTIDPDGPSGAIAPITVYCDMTSDGGGWTTLPLRWNDPSYWSITETGTSCVTLDLEDNQGNYRQYFSSAGSGFAYTSMQLVLPIPASAMRFVDFSYTNGGSQNTMDFVIGEAPSTGLETVDEGWYFVDANGNAVGYTFASVAGCVSPYEIERQPPVCTRDLDPSAVPFLLNETVSFTAEVASFTMVVAQGCTSALASPLSEGEQFYVANPPGSDGVWHTGIQIR